MRLFDSHCHVQDERLLEHAPAVLSRARQTGVERLLCCGCEEKDWPDVAALAHAGEMIVPAFGLHPWYVPDRTAAWRDAVESFLKSHPGAGVGEIGLDHALKQRNDDEQGDVFLSQLRLARDMGRPVSIHCRQAWGQLLAYEAELRALPRGFVIHSYSGGKDLIPPLARAGACFSFSGTVTWSRNVKAHASCREVPAERLLIETDAPDLMPTIPGQEPPAGEAREKPANEPANLLYVLRKVAELRGEPDEAIAALTWENAVRLFCGG